MTREGPVGPARSIIARARRLAGSLRQRGESAGPPPELQQASTYSEPGNQWYYPPVAGPSSFLPDVVGTAPVELALEVLDRLSTDSYLDFVRSFYRKGISAFGRHWVYADINTVLLGLTRRLAPSSYLEIGVRRGRSMAMVVSQAPACRIVGFDLWVENYAGMENPGPRLVREEMARLGFTGELDFVDGDSKETVPRFFEQHPGEFFDIITVDGDHSTDGARRDLENVMPHLKLGGALVFDDISNQSHPSLLSVWKETVERDDRFVSYSFTEAGFGVGFAIRKS
jgi:predicted O-methyltransferase YrrM